MRVLVTGSAGFIGSATSHRLLARGDEVIGIDNLNDYYDVHLKEARLARLTARPGYRHLRVDLADRGAVDRAFRESRPERIVHLAAQAGVRYSLQNPQAYVDANVTGFLSVLENARAHGTGHLVFASTSSVYGLNTHRPFSEQDNVDHPISLYAATKKCNELMAHSYSHLFAIPCTGLRFFTVYGPWGRPDMALFEFTRRLLAGEPIDVYGHGHHTRDFTYVDDTAEGIVRILDRPAEADPQWNAAAPAPASSTAPYRIYNIGGGAPASVSVLIELLERALGRRAEKRLLATQPGDVADTFADVSALAETTGYRPRTALADGVQRFVDWYRDYYGGSR